MTIWSWETWRDEQKSIYDWADWQEQTHEETWQAATMAERERCAMLAERLKTEVNQDVADKAWNMAIKVTVASIQSEAA